MSTRVFLTHTLRTHAHTREVRERGFGLGKLNRMSVMEVLHLYAAFVLLESCVSGILITKGKGLYLHTVHIHLSYCDNVSKIFCFVGNCVVCLVLGIF